MCMLVTRDSVWPRNAARNVKFSSEWAAWVPELWDADQIPQTTATVAIFRRGSPCLELMSVHKTFSATGTSNRGYIGMPGFSLLQK